MSLSAHISRNQLPLDTPKVVFSSDIKVNHESQLVLGLTKLLYHIIGMKNTLWLFQIQNENLKHLLLGILLLKANRKNSSLFLNPYAA